MGGGGRGRLLAVALVVLSTAMSLYVCDLFFRFYERSRLGAALPEPGTSGLVDLQALNYNDFEIETALAPGEFRVLSFGDSFGYSIMRPEFSYAGILQARLDERIPDRARVVNLGEPATTVRDYVAAHRYWSQVLEHQAVLFLIYLGNDVLDVAYGYAPAEWVPNRIFGEFDFNILDGRQRRIPHRYPLRMLDHAHALLLTAKNQTHRSAPSPEFNVAASDDLTEERFLSTNIILLDNHDPSKLERLARGYLAVERLFVAAREIARSGKQVLVALGPSQIQVDPALLEGTLVASEGDAAGYDFRLSMRIIAEIHRRTAPEVPLLDMVEYLRADFAQRGVDLYHRRNTHWGKEGNRLAGELLADATAAAWFGQPRRVGSLDAARDAMLERYVPLVSDTTIGEFLDTSLQDHDPPSAY